MNVEPTNTDKGCTLPAEPKYVLESPKRRAATDIATVEDWEEGEKDFPKFPGGPVSVSLSSWYQLFR